MLRRSSLLLLLVVGCGTVRGQAPILRVTPESLEHWPQVGFDVRVLGRDGAPIENIRAEQLALRDDGVAASVAELRPAAAEPQSVCLVLDQSGSSYGERDSIHEIMDALIPALPAKDEVCLVTYNAEPHLDVPLTMVHEQIARGLERSRSSGGSAMLDALEFTLAEMQKNARFRSQAIVLITDGGENASSISEDQTARYFAETGAPTLFCIQLKDDTASPRELEHNRKSISELAENTGGIDFRPKAKERQAAVAELVQTLTGRYRLVYTSPLPNADGREHRLEIKLSKDLSKQKVSLVAPRRYYAPVH